jgi:hypothetical protein
MDKKYMQVLEKINKERERIDVERAKIEERIERLKDDVSKMAEAENDSIVERGFDIEALENAAVNENKEALLRKISVLEKALKQDYYSDVQFRLAAKEYIEIVEDMVKECDEKIKSNGHELQEAKNKVQMLEERNEKENYELHIKIEKLLHPVAASTFCENSSGVLSGPYVVYKVKTKLQQSKD